MRRSDQVEMRHVADGTAGKPLFPWAIACAGSQGGGCVRRWIMTMDNWTAETGKGLTG